MRKLLSVVLMGWLCLTGKAAWAQSSIQVGMANDPFWHCYGCRFPVYKDGGVEGMMRHIGQRLRYPHHLTENGRVFVQFTIDEAGKVQDVLVKQGFQPAADSAAVRAVKTLGDFIPATDANGRPIAVRQLIPVSFRFD